MGRRRAASVLRSGTCKVGVGWGGVGFSALGVAAERTHGWGGSCSMAAARAAQHCPRRPLQPLNTRPHLDIVVQGIQQGVDVVGGAVGSDGVHTCGAGGGWWGVSERVGELARGQHNAVQHAARLHHQPASPQQRSPFHQPMFSVFLIRLSPIQPEMGRMGTDFSTKSGFHPTRTSMCFISSLISL